MHPCIKCFAFVFAYGVARRRPVPSRRARLSSGAEPKKKRTPQQVGSLCFVVDLIVVVMAVVVVIIFLRAACCLSLTLVSVVVLAGGMGRSDYVGVVIDVVLVMAD